MKAFVEEHAIPCPSCGGHDWTDIRQFNLMFKTFQGVTEDAKNTVYLRPETAQGIFVNFQNVSAPPGGSCPSACARWANPSATRSLRATSPSAPGSSSRWSWSSFCTPGTELEWFQYWKDFCRQWLLSLGMQDGNLRLRDHDPEELSHYSNATTDFEFLFPSAGASCGAWPAGRTLTSRPTRPPPART